MDDKPNTDCSFIKEDIREDRSSVYVYSKNVVQSNKKHSRFVIANDIMVNNNVCLMLYCASSLYASNFS